MEIKSCAVYSQCYGAHSQLVNNTANSAQLELSLSKVMILVTTIFTVSTYHNNGCSDSPNICRAKVRVFRAGAVGLPGGGAEKGGHPVHRIKRNR